MPNWCYNHVSITHSDAEKIKQMEAATKENKLFETFAPIGEWDYGTAIDQWGTKWDASVNDVYILSANELELSFDTAWAPPIAFYDKLVEQGFEVSANYEEDGMCFIGRYSNEEGDICIDYNFDDEDWAEQVEDDELLSVLKEKYESYLEWKEDSESDYDEEEE